MKNLLFFPLLFSMLFLLFVLLNSTKAHGSYSLTTTAAATATATTNILYSAHFLNNAIPTHTFCCPTNVCVYFFGSSFLLQLFFFLFGFFLFCSSTVWMGYVQMLTQSVTHSFIHSFVISLSVLCTLTHRCGRRIASYSAPKLLGRKAKYVPIIHHYSLYECDIDIDIDIRHYNNTWNEYFELPTWMKSMKS